MKSKRMLFAAATLFASALLSAQTGLNTSSTAGDALDAGRSDKPAPATGTPYPRLDTSKGELDVSGSSRTAGTRMGSTDASRGNLDVSGSERALPAGSRMEPALIPGRPESAVGRDVITSPTTRPVPPAPTTSRASLSAAEKRQVEFLRRSRENNDRLLNRDTDTTGADTSDRANTGDRGALDRPSGAAISPPPGGQGSSRTGGTGDMGNLSGPNTGQRSTAGSDTGTRDSSGVGTGGNTGGTTGGAGSTR